MGDQLSFFEFDEEPFEGGLDEDDRTRGYAEKINYMIVIQCQDESQQVELLKRFANEGIKCRALIG